AMSNLIQPQWRAWMGRLVPQRQRGIFFATRTCLTIRMTLATILIGRGLLTFIYVYALAWDGFLALFFMAAIGRALSCYFLWCMHDPDAEQGGPQGRQVLESLARIRESMSDPTFRNYTFFVAGMQGAVAISGPFFAVYMMEELHYSYIEYSINLMASIATQFFMLRYWGKVSDKHGNRLVMLICSA